MTTARIHIGGSSLPATFLVRILNRLRESSSRALRQRLADWRASGMGGLGLSFDGRVQLIDRAVSRINQDLARVTHEFVHDKEHLMTCILLGSVFEFKDEHLDLELLIDLHAFLSELRCAIELLEEFLRAFFETVLDAKPTGEELRQLLRDRGVDDTWIGHLWNIRDLLLHDATPPLAVEILSIEPLKFELLLQKHPSSNDDFPGPTSLSELEKFYQGFRVSLHLIEELLIAEIEAFEDRRA